MEIRPLEDDALTRLYEASIEGSLITFNSLIQKDPLILSRISLSTFNETPLHISALLGHLDFTRQLLFHKPKLASELDSHKRSPLHLASAEGHTEVVQALLQENGDQNMCLAKDQDGKIPLHYAALRGRIDVIKLLISARKESVLEVDPDGQTVLHLCVKYNHLEALKMLVELEIACENCEFLNSKEHDGNTILHLAVMLKQVETVEYLLSVPKIKAAADEIVNLRGLKAFELLEYISGTDFISERIRQKFKDSGLETSTSSAITQKSSTEKSSDRKSRNWFGFLKYRGDWVEDKPGSIMVVSTVISTMTYQTAINPPGGIWQQTTDQDNFNGCSIEDPCIAGTSVLAREPGDQYTLFMIFNSISFLASLSIILLLISGVRLRNKLFMFLMTLVMCTAVTALALTFLVGMALVTPGKRIGLLSGILKASIVAWIILHVFIFLFHDIRFLYWTVKKLCRHRNKLYMFLLTLVMYTTVTALAVIFLIVTAMVIPRKGEDLFYKIFVGSIFAWIILLAFILLFYVIRFLYSIVKKLRRLFKPKSSRTN